MRGLLSGEFTEIRSLSWGATFTDKNFVTEKDDVEASFLVMDAERDIAKANPPEVGGRGNKGVTRSNTLVSPENLRNMRQAHDNLSDSIPTEKKVVTPNNDLSISWGKQVGIRKKNRPIECRVNATGLSRK